MCRAMDTVNIDIRARSKSIRRSGRFYQIPIKSAVKMQLGSLAIITDVLMNRSPVP